MKSRKYTPLEEFLRRQEASEVPMTFAEIERVIDAKLPQSAYDHRPVWSNNPSNSVITHAWLNAGFESSDVDMKARKLVFRRGKPRGRATSKASEPRVSDGTRSYAVELRHPIFGVLKGTIRISPETDLTAPADPDWGAVDE